MPSPNDNEQKRQGQRHGWGKTEYRQTNRIAGKSFLMNSGYFLLVNLSPAS